MWITKKSDIQSIQVSMYPKKQISIYPSIHVSNYPWYPSIHLSKYPRYPSIRLSEKSGIHSSLPTTYLVNFGQRDFLTTSCHFVLQDWCNSKPQKSLTSLTKTVSLFAAVVLGWMNWKWISAWGLSFAIRTGLYTYDWP